MCMDKAEIKKLLDEAIAVEQADGSLRPEARMDVKHAANAVVQMAKLPVDTNVMFMTIMATQMPFVGRG